MDHIYVPKDTRVYSLKIHIIGWILAYTLIFISPVFSYEQKKQPDNIKQCFTCFLKKFSDWTWDQEKRLGKRDDPKYVTCRRVKRVRAKNGSDVCVYRGANDTWVLQVEFNCPPQFQCKYDPDQKEPSIDSVVDSLNDSFKR